MKWRLFGVQAIKWMFVSLQELYRLQGPLLWLDQRKHLLIPQTWDQVWHLSIRIYITTTHAPAVCSTSPASPYWHSVCLVYSLSVFQSIWSFACCFDTFLCSLSVIQMFFISLFCFLIYFHFCHSSQGDSTPSRPPIVVPCIIYLVWKSLVLSATVWASE